MTSPSEPEFDKSRNTGFRHLINATRFSLSGLGHALKNESAFRQELALALILIPTSFFVGTTPVKIAALIVSVLFVMLVELLNSAIEAVVDRVGTEHHRLSGQAKDLGSAAVMISLLIAGIVWATLIFERFFQ